MSEMPERAYEDCQDKLKKATVKSYQTIMQTSPIGGALEAVRPKVNARAQVCGGWVRPETSRIGVYRRKLRFNKNQGQVHPNVTEVYVPIVHMMLGNDDTREKFGQTYNGFANWYYNQSRKQRGGRLLR